MLNLTSRRTRLMISLFVFGLGYAVFVAIVSDDCVRDSCVVISRLMEWPGLLIRAALVAAGLLSIFDRAYALVLMASFVFHVAALYLLLVIPAHLISLTSAGRISLLKRSLRFTVLYLLSWITIMFVLYLVIRDEALNVAFELAALFEHPIGFAITRPFMAFLNGVAVMLILANGGGVFRALLAGISIPLIFMLLRLHQLVPEWLKMGYEGLLVCLYYLTPPLLSAALVTLWAFCSSSRCTGTMRAGKEESDSR